MRRLALLLTLSSALCLPPVIHAQEPAKSAETSESAEQRPGDKWFWWKLVNLAILAGILGVVIKKKGAGFFTRRTEQIQAALRDAEKSKQDSEARLADMEKRLAKLGEEIERMRTAMRHEMAVEGERIHVETEHHLNRIQKQTEAELENISKRARHELTLYAAELALNLAEQQLRARTGRDLENRLVEAFVADLRSGAGKGKLN